MGRAILSWLCSKIRKVKEVARSRRFFFIFSLDEFRLKNIFKKFFEKSIDIFKKSVIIDNVKRESRMTEIKMGGDLSAV